jgi:hypothetical protein
MLDPAISAFIIACFATLFAAAAMHKFRSPAEFDALLAAYQLLPSAIGIRLSIIIPILEAATAVGLLLLRGTWRSGCAYVGAGLLLAYALAIGINLIRGRRDISCGCAWGVRRPIAAWMVWRNIVLAAVLTTATLPSGERSLEPTDVVTISVGLVVVALLYLSVENLLSAGAGRMSKRRSIG